MTWNDSGTFTTIEVLKTIEKGYKVLQIHEVWNFEKTSNDLFSEYVNYFLRLKQESSGFPDWVKTPEDEARYIDEYYKHEGILLRRDKIVENPGMHAFAKLCLNSLWGRFAMRTDRVMTEFITDPLQFYKHINGADTENDLCLLIDDLVEVVFKRKQEYAEESKATNLFIGIFTTAWARLELYNLLDLLGESVLYVDTDSCVPKNYAYKVNNGKTHCKIRGFTLNYTNSLVLNFDSLKDVICKYVSGPARKVKKSRKNKNSVNSLKIINECKISREKWTRRIVNKREVKQYNVFDKRIVLGKGEDTIPYGFHWIPSTNETVVQKSITPVPNSFLYTLIHHPALWGNRAMVWT